MRPENKIYLIMSIILVILIIGIFSIKLFYKESATESLTKCISNNSHLYSFTGCSHCQEQRRLFGDYYNLLSVTDCINDTQECVHMNVTATPSWYINDTMYVGYKSLKQLKELTGC